MMSEEFGGHVCCAMYISGKDSSIAISYLGETFAQLLAFRWVR